MIAKIGHAVCDENGKSQGGKAGDQSKKELRIADWYKRDKGWTNVFRAKSAKTAQKIADAMKDACANDKIGYDQGQRTTLWLEAEKVGFKLAKIKTKCETDCSALVAVCLKSAGIDISRDIWTGNEAAAIRATKRFTEYKTPDYTDTYKNLKPGDVLLGPGHTAIVVEADEPAEEVKPATVEEKKNVRVQVGAYKNPYSANSICQELKDSGKAPSAFVVAEEPYYKVIADVFADRKGADAFAKTLGCATYVYTVKG